MSYLISYHALWLFAALVFGLIAGAITLRDQAPRLMDGTVWAAVIAWLIGCFVAWLKLLPDRAGYVLELALLLSFAYAIGCFLGWALRKQMADSVSRAAEAGRSSYATPLGRQPIVPATVTARNIGASARDALVRSAPARTEVSAGSAAPARVEPSTAHRREPPPAHVPPASARSGRPAPSGAPPVPVAGSPDPSKLTQPGMPSMMRDRFTRVFLSTLPSEDESAPSGTSGPGEAPSPMAPAPSMPMRSPLFPSSDPIEVRVPGTADVATRPDISSDPASAPLDASARSAALPATEPTVHSSTAPVSPANSVALPPVTSPPVKPIASEIPPSVAIVTRPTLSSKPEAVATIEPPEPTFDDSGTAGPTGAETTTVASGGEGAVPAGPVHPGIKPFGLAASRGAADDLKRIRGIGPQNEGRLHGLGIWHFHQIAAWTAENIEWVGGYLAFPGRIDREAWVDQAKTLATGAETLFSKRVDADEVPSSVDDGSAGQDNIQRSDRKAN